ncbi:unnamed protein product [Acanthosepion pharaonis]|uniref:C2H2-type domain-containing protein n=1 Tax=Acanthosepion pharaonis TaxID=158019 RepID=A0A812C9H5_ACAPH|nr:unnamed protein product [Sepia pharaonis]
MQFASLRDMQLHVLSHTHGKTLHSCTVCGRSYTTPSKLQRHVRVHSGERPYMCNLCGRRFTRSDHVKQHMKVHQPHRQKNMCRICGVRFARSSLLGSHLRRHSIHMIHVCRRCGEGFQENEELLLHRKLHKMKSNLRPNGRRRSRGAPVDMSALTSVPPDDINPKMPSEEISRQTLSSPEISQQRLPSPEVSRETLSALKAVIKREPGCAKDQDSRYTMSLLARNPVAVAQCHPFMKYSEDLQRHAELEQGDAVTPPTLNGKRLSKCDHCGMCKTHTQKGFNKFAEIGCPELQNGQLSGILLSCQLSFMYKEKGE